MIELIEREQSQMSRDDDVQRWARAVAAYYTRGDDWRANMPWTCDQMTLGQFEEWVDDRKEAGLTIDPATCEVGHWYALDCDPYGIREAKGELPDPPDEMRNRFVRSPESRGWVGEWDLPAEKQEALEDRIEREQCERRRKRMT